MACCHATEIGPGDKGEGRVISPVEDTWDAHAKLSPRRAARTNPQCCHPVPDRFTVGIARPAKWIRGAPLHGYGSAADTAMGKGTAAVRTVVEQFERRDSPLPSPPPIGDMTSTWRSSCRAGETVIGPVIGGSERGTKEWAFRQVDSCRAQTIDAALICPRGRFRKRFIGAQTVLTRHKARCNYLDPLRERHSPGSARGR